MKNLLVKMKESLFAVGPISLTVIVLGLSVGGFDASLTLSFILGAVMVILGMALFTLGVDAAIMPMGEMIGGNVMRTRKLWLIILASFVAGAMVTIAEPGLRVFSSQFGSLFNPWILIIFVSVGVGVFFVLAILKTIFNLSLNKLLIIFYSSIFLFAIVMQLSGKSDFISVAFDSGGSATGSVSVPFIMAFGIGVAAIKADGKSEDSFGMLALSAIGPVLAVMVLGLLYSTEGFAPAAAEGDVSLVDYLNAIPSTLLDVLLPLGMILIFFMAFQLTLIKTPHRTLLKIMVGMCFTFVGLIMFLIGAEVGFLPVGNLLGSAIGAKTYRWILIPVGVLVGFFIVGAEPAIVVLNQKVEEISGGTISKKSMLLSLMIGIGAAIGLSMMRILFDVSIWFIIAPAYIIAVALTFFVPKVFTAVAFDSGCVASGPMTSAFLLPFALGAAEQVGTNIMANAFGVIAVVVVAPPLTIQLMGLITVINAKKRAKRITAIESDDYQIIELD